jgi:uncharacterized protein YcfJ
MNKSMLLGVVGGVGIATAGGVLGYQFLGQPSVSEQGSAVVVADDQVAVPSELVVARAEPAATPAPAARPAPAPAARPATARPAAAPRAIQPAAAPTVAAAPAEECWDEEVTVAADPTDQHQIAGTALGAVVGGAIGKDVGDRDITTAAGAAAGAFIGRKIQQRIQENRAETRTVTTVERRCAPVGTPH